MKKLIKDLRGNIIQKESKINLKSSNTTDQKNGPVVAESTTTIFKNLTASVIKFTTTSVVGLAESSNQSSIRCYGCSAPTLDCTVPCRYPQKCFLRSSTPESESKIEK